MCGVIGIYSHKPVAQELYDGLIHLQHRGQDAAGISTYNGHFHIEKGAGYVRDVFRQTNMERLEGNWGLGHTRYPTAGSKHAVENAQPFIINAPYGIAMAHNGDLTNYAALKKELAEKDLRHCNSSSDLEVIMNVFASCLEGLNQKNDFFDNICEAVGSVYTRTSGAYSVVGIIAGKGMIAFRDPHGIRPLVYGERINADGTRGYIFSSENTMYYPLGFELKGNVAPGEVVFIDDKGGFHRRTLRQEQFTPDVFEYVYLARPDAMLNNVSVYRARLRMGENLAKRWMEKYPDVVPDIVIPVPFSSNTAALAFAGQIGVRYSEGLYKNPFVGRTFIMPGQEKRRKSVLQKLSPQETEIKDKVVLLLDDSIVRGTTSKEVVKLVRDAGAKKVYFVSACPPVKFPDFYGIDMPTRAELIAAHKNEEEIREYIGADILLYQQIEDLVEAVTRKGEHNIDRLSMPYLDGWYVTGDIDEARSGQLEVEKGLPAGQAGSKS
jgi:amidophosphoribosyltransferase